MGSELLTKNTFMHEYFFDQITAKKMYENRIQMS